ncbi:efflux RND transporter periplasmic adaptor subunit [Hypericibacter sp.]|uniref:efflux RND transporter periplasmic adaptor subunit n=1 Tax=Hypericibacter sp. TaxID=2705401 RepID=UPI003D6D0524
MSRRLAILLLVGAVVVAGGGYWLLKSRAASLGPDAVVSTSATKPAGTTAAPQAVPVVLGMAETRSLPVRVDTIGRVDPFATVAVKSQVDGPLLAVHFREGQQVAKGDLLFTIDPAPFLAELHAAQANLARDQAGLVSAQADMTRYKALAGSGYASQQKDEQARATVDTLQASIKADEAAVESAQLKLGYAEIRSPIDGRTGSYQVDAGNLVKANDTTPLVVINQTKPVYVVCSIPERYLAEIQDRMASSGLTVESNVPDTELPPVTGKVVFVDNQVDMATGTIRLKAEITNENERLLPGQFLRVTLALRELDNVVAVPDAAVQIGQQGTYVYVIGPDNKAELRTIRRGPSFDGYTAVGEGVSAGERVVVDGHMNLYPGALVVPKPAS